MSKNILNYCDISGTSVKEFKGNRKYIATGDILNNKIINFTDVNFKNKPSRANQNVEIGNIIFAKMKDTIKVIKITEENVNNIYSTGFYVIKPKENILTDYLYWLFNSPYFNISKDKNCRGATQKALNNEGLKKIEISKMPDIKGQKNIIDILNKIQKVIDVKKQQIKEFEELIKSQFVEMFGDLKLNNKGWKYVDKIENLCILNPKKNELENLENIEVSFISMQSVSEKGDINTEETRLLNDVKKGFTYFKENDVLFAKITPCMENGKGTIAKGLKNNIGFGSTEFHILRPKDNINSTLLYTLTSLTTFRKEAEMKMTGSAGQKRVPINFLANYKIGVPPIELQNQFAEFVKQIDKQKSKIQKSLEQMQILQESLMNKYFY